MNFELRATGPVGRQSPRRGEESLPSEHVVPEPEQRVRQTRRELPEVLDVGKKHLERTIATAEYVTQENIRAYVASLVSQYNDILLATPESLLAKQKPLLLAEALSDEGIEAMYYTAIERLAGEDPFLISELSEEELQQAMDPIRRGIIEEFRRQGVDVGDVYMVRKEIQAGNRKYLDTEGTERYKQRNRIFLVDRAKDASSGVYHENIFRGEELHRQELRAAMDLLKKEFATMTEKEKKYGYPYVLDVHRYDPNTLATVVEVLDMKETLFEAMDSIQTKKDLIRILDIWGDGVFGGNFLAENGLMLMDIKPKNIGIHKTDGEEHGILFDLDGLYRLGAPVHQPISSPEYEVPEKDEEVVIATEQQMTYQFGVMLKEILLEVSISMGLSDKDNETLRNLEDLAAAMSEQKPEKRLTIASALDQFEDMIEKLDR